jgi:hypothetical protein
MPQRLYESYADEETSKKLAKCIKDYLNGTETQIYYCNKHNIKLSAFKRYWAKYKDKNKDNLREMKEKLLNKSTYIDDKSNKLPIYDSSAEKIFKKQIKQNDSKSSEYANNMGGGTQQKIGKTNSGVVDAKSFFGGITDLA